jgi:hypothetical protein
MLLAGVQPLRKQGCAVWGDLTAAQLCRLVGSAAFYRGHAIW